KIDCPPAMIMSLYYLKKQGQQWKFSKVIDVGKKRRWLPKRQLLELGFERILSKDADMDSASGTCNSET
ncbi:5250_t:CDS:2, partial [Gigaspora margarita]